MDPFSSDTPTTALRPEVEKYLGRPVPQTEEISLSLHDVLVLATREREMLEKIRAEAEGSLGKTTFRVLDRIILILRGDE